MATFVLIHGSYQGGWIWKPVAQRLRAAGHEVYAPTLEGCGERAEQIRAGITTETHAEEVAKLPALDNRATVSILAKIGDAQQLARTNVSPAMVGEIVRMAITNVS